jgi:hypothetical protein
MSGKSGTNKSNASFETLPTEKSFKVYPNPNNGQLILKLNNVKKSALVGIYNIL